MSEQIIHSVSPVPLSERGIATRFRKLLLAGHPLRPAGQARKDPDSLLRRYTPKYEIELFETRFFLSTIRRDDNGFRFFVAFVLLPRPGTIKDRHPIYPRIFYKDSSLIWRSATHYINTDDEHWVGKGDLKPVIEEGREVWYSAEETTNLPYELQSALDELSRRTSNAATDNRGLSLVLRNAPNDRVHPYRDFSEPREKARSDPDRHINNGKPIAVFRDDSDPASLEIIAGFEPDFADGIIDTSNSISRIYGGAIRKFRIASANRQIQYMFVAAPRHAWIIPPQTLDRELLSYGPRTTEVDVDEKLCIPGYEYHYMDDTVDPPELHTQIPPGFAGAASEVDPARADVSAWNDKMWVIQQFRRFVA